MSLEKYLPLPGMEFGVFILTVFLFASVSDNDFTETLCFVVFLHLQQVNVATQIYPKKKQKKTTGPRQKKKKKCLHSHKYKNPKLSHQFNHVGRPLTQ